MTDQSLQDDEDAVGLRIHAALQAQAETVDALSPRRAIAGGQQWAREHRWRPALFAAAAVILIVVGIAVGLATGRGGHHAPAATAPTLVATSTPATSAASAPPTAAPSGTTGPISFSLGHLALWPFQSTREELDWQRAYASSGTDAWHLDADATATRFAAEYLGFTDMNAVTSRDDVAGTLQVGVGFGAPGNATAAVITLERTSTTGPWEATGATSSALSITSPAAGTTVDSNITVRGRITGVDENIKVTVRQQSATPVGQSCCQPAGGTAAPWSTSVALSGAQPGVVAIVASTGGHLEAVEKFVVVGVLVS